MEIRRPRGSERFVQKIRKPQCVVAGFLSNAQDVLSKVQGVGILCPIAGPICQSAGVILATLDKVVQNTEQAEDLRTRILELSSTLSKLAAHNESFLSPETTDSLEQLHKHMRDIEEYVTDLSSKKSFKRYLSRHEISSKLQVFVFQLDTLMESYLLCAAYRTELKLRKMLNDLKEERTIAEKQQKFLVGSTESAPCDEFPPKYEDSIVPSQQTYVPVGSPKPFSMSVKIQFTLEVRLDETVFIVVAVVFIMVVFFSMPQWFAAVFIVVSPYLRLNPELPHSNSAIPPVEKKLALLYR